jgi:hypothetical protein
MDDVRPSGARDAALSVRLAGASVSRPAVDTLGVRPEQARGQRAWRRPLIKGAAALAACRVSPAAQIRPIQ